MELTISIKDKKVYASLLQFLKSLGVKVKGKGNRTTRSAGKKMSKSLEKIARSGGIKSIPNPSKWQKKLRKNPNVH